MPVFGAKSGDLASAIQFHMNKPFGIDGSLGSLIPILQHLLDIPLRMAPRNGIHGFDSDLGNLTTLALTWMWFPIALAVMLFDSVAFRSVISNGLVLDKDGNKMSKRLANTIDPYLMLNRYGADALRWYMVVNAPPWDNLKFDPKGVEEVQRKFFGTLYNTYQFFALYANVDGFSFAEPPVPLAERPEIDRWILSSLHSLIKKVTAAMDDYEPTVAGRAIESFVDEQLSNWYVRLCRRRFWKGEYEQDKISAYQTLYECLETVIQLTAPIAPFFMDKLYQDLNTVTGKETSESIHLADFPKSDVRFIDASLERKMENAQIISSLVLSLRAFIKLLFLPDFLKFSVFLKVKITPVNAALKSS